MNRLVSRHANQRSHNPAPLSEFAREFLGFDPFTSTRLAQSSRPPRFDLLSNPEEYVLRGDLPGILEEDLEITVHEGVLTIKGQRNATELTEDSQYLVRERVHGEFSRSLVLPKDADQANVAASLDDGVLQVRIAKKAELQARRIAIE